MTSEEWQRVRLILESALELDCAKRPSYLDRECSDPSLRRELESLIAAHEQAGTDILNSQAAPGFVAKNERRFRLPPGQRIGAYEILGEIGVGGMGAVYRAIRADGQYRQKVALKIVRSELGAGSIAQRFRNERQILASLDHPNIGKILDGGTTVDGLPYFVMEFIDGLSITEYCDQNRLSIHARLRIFRTVCSAVHYAHQHLVIHRDLKPGNILITAEGVPKLLDFGIAKILDTELLPETLTMTGPGLWMMTPEYASPEQVRGQPVTAASDVYSLGVVLYELLTGRRPYRLLGHLPYEIARVVLDTDPERPSAAVLRKEEPATAKEKAVPTPELVRELRADSPEKLRRRLAGDLDNIVLKAIQKESRERYSSVDQLSEDIRCHLEGLPIIARKNTIAYRSRKYILRHKVGVAAAAFVTLVVLLLLAVLLFRTRLARHAQDSSEWVQLTNFVDSATSPALSRDGRTLVFLRGPSTFASQAEVYVQKLSGGDPIALTHDGIPKMSPVFSPDGSQIAYTVPGAWDTWILPTLGGEPRKFLPNASGLTWISGRQMLFSELREGRHMVLATSEENRNGERMVFAPPGKGSMVHRSFLSPDGKWVIAVWMSTEGGWNGWESCRLVPFDRNTAGKPVGPADAACTNAAWSPDGQWMYFSAEVRGKFHTWRQRFPDGPVEQVTSGVNEEEGIAITPDGRSLVTSVGTYETSIWVHDGKGDHQITSQGHAYLNPETSGRTVFSADGSRVYYLVDRRPQGGASELWFAEISTGKNEAVVADSEPLGFDLSPDGGSVVYSVRTSEGKHALWTARVDHLVPPKQLTLTGNNFSPAFTPQGDVVFTSREGEEMFLYRMKADGSDSRKVSDQPVIQLQTVSPDGRWAVAQAEVKNEDVPRGVFAIPLDGGATIRLCSGLCSVRWPHDGKSVFISEIGGSQGYAISWATYVVPIPPGQLFPKLPPMGIASKADAEALPGAKYMDNFGLPGETGEIFAFNRASVHRNLFKILLQ